VPMTMKKHRRNGHKYVSDSNRRGNTRHLTRIITILSELPEGTYKTNLSEHYGVGTNTYVSDALNWLVCNGIVTKIRRNEMNIYKINKEFLKLRKCITSKK